MELSIAELGYKRDTDKVQYIRQLIKDHSVSILCTAILTAIEEGSIHPDIMSMFLNCSASHESALRCLQQGFSLHVKSAAMRFFCKAMKPADQCQQTWEILGGLEGLLQFLASASVREVNDFVTGWSTIRRGLSQSFQRDLAIEQLLISLLPSLGVHSRQTPALNPDRRQLQNLYLRLIPACSSDFVVSLVTKDDGKLLSQLSLKAVLRSHHGDIMKQQMTSVLESGKDMDQWLAKAFRAFTTAEPPEPGQEHHFSASMEFSEGMLRWRLAHAETKSWPGSVGELEVYYNLMRRCLKRRIRGERLHNLLALGLDLLTLISYQNYADRVRKAIWEVLCKRWIFDQTHWENLFTRGLQLGLAGSNDIGKSFLSFTNTNKMVDNIRMWDLFRLYSLHIPKKGTDLSQTGGFSGLVKQSWSIEIFYRFENDKSLLLLQELIRLNVDYDFLIKPNSRSILDVHTAGRPNLNAHLLLGLLAQRSTDQDTRQIIRDELTRGVDGYRQRAAASREQKDRADLAKVACFMAIASGSLDVYAETITWCQRFVRDPLTVKSLFSEFVVGTAEGIELLAGILRKGGMSFTLEDASMRVSKANAILQTFVAHMKLAEREPSFAKKDWTAVSSLCAKAIQTRINNARILQKALKATEIDMYSAIWTQTIAILPDIGLEAMERVSSDLRGLLSTLSPKMLKTTIEFLVETDEAYRKAKMQGQAEGESRIVENLVYTSLNQLVASDNPLLARDLIIRIIIERPDASSWHRSLLTLGYLKRLGSREAEEMLLAFATAIGEKLQEQNYVKVGEKPGAPSLVKVSTVKYLAQMLKDAQFISASATVDVLVELFQNATHIDIRIATFESLISTLFSDRGAQPVQFDARTFRSADAIVERTLAALETIVPVAGSINERRPPTAQDWAVAEEDPTKLPAIFDIVNMDGGEDKPPLLEQMIRAAIRMLREPGKAEMGRVFLAKVILPTVAQLQTETERWMAIFVRKHGWTDTQSDLIASLPIIPFTTAIIDELLSHASAMTPKPLLDAVGAYSEFMIREHDSLQALNTALRADPKKRNLPDVQYWLKIYGRSVSDIIKDVHRRHFSLLLTHHADPDVVMSQGQAITPSDSQRAIAVHLDLLLARYDHFIGPWDTFFQALKPAAVYNAREVTCWVRFIHPVVLQIAAKITAQRSDTAWLYDSNRDPAFLPPTATMEAWCALVPYLVAANENVSGADGREDSAEALAAQTWTFVKSQLGSPLRTVNIDSIFDAILDLKGSMHEIEQIVVGITMGEQTGNLEDDTLGCEAESRLCLALAERLIGGLQRSHSELPVHIAERIWRLPDIWQASPFEHVREAAWRLRRTGSKLWNKSGEDFGKTVSAVRMGSMESSTRGRGRGRGRGR